MNVEENIIVQLVHIESSQKGEIQELTCPTILFGRHADCQVRFPKDAVTLSRKHAQIVREGNRFKLIDQSTNGTFVNGQQISEAYLREGDVIMFTNNGPKISFLTRMREQPVPPPLPPPPPDPNESAESSGTTIPPEAAEPQPSSPAVQSSSQPAPAEAPAPSAQINQSVAIAFIIQYGPMLKSFRSLPITLGKGPHCDFVINHPALCDKQAQIFFYQDQYWVKDLTGTNAILIDNMPIAGQAALRPDIQLSLSPLGPRFLFLNNGRLVEFEASFPDAPPPPPQVSPGVSRKPGMLSIVSRKAASLFKKLFKNS